MPKLLATLILAAVVLVLLAQLVPYGRAHDNPPVRLEPQWDSPTTRDLAVRACYDCHSNETVWPWYSGVAPISWLVQRDVEEGRQKLNFSEWDRPLEKAHESAEQVQKGEMPPSYYVPLHPPANLSADERAALIGGLQATFGTAAGEGRESREHDD